MGLSASDAAPADERAGTPPPDESSAAWASLWPQRLEILRSLGVSLDLRSADRALMEALLRIHDPAVVVRAAGEPDAERVKEPATPPFYEIEELPRDLVRFRVFAIGPGAGLALGAALDRAIREGARGVVLDLREAGGDSLADVAHIVARYAGGGQPVCEIHDLRGNVLEQVVTPGARRPPREGLPPLVSLVGPGTRAAAEILAAALDRCPRAMSVGRPTAQDPLIRDTLEMPGGWQVRMATRRVVFPDGGELSTQAPYAPRWAWTDDSAPPPPEPARPNGGWPDRRRALPQEAEDQRLNERLREDPDLRRAVDLLLALAALQSQD